MAKAAHNDSASMKPGGSYRVSNTLWKAIWKLRVSPKIKHFMWRLCSGALATKENLWKRKCATNPCCPCCEDCGASDFCFSSSLALKYDLHDVTRLDRWLEDIIDNSKLGEFDLALLATLCWFVWKDRCRTALDPLETAFKASYSVSQFWHTNGWLGPDEITVFERSVSAWKPPPVGVIKINCDGAFVNETKRAGLGVIFRDYAGDLIESACVTTVASSDFMAEALALKKGMQMALDLDMKEVMFESDCEGLVKAVVDDICFMKLLFSSCEVAWARRSTNLAAVLVF